MSKQGSDRKRSTLGNSQTAYPKPGQTAYQKPRRSSRKSASRDLRKSDNKRKRRSGEDAKEPAQPTVVVGGRLIVAMDYVQDSHIGLVTRFLEIVVSLDKGDDRCALKSITVHVPLVEEGSVAFRQPYAIEAVWEGTKEISSEDSTCLEAIAHGDVAIRKFSWTMKSISPSVTTLLQNAKELEKMGVEGEDTEHRTQLLGFRSLLRIDLSIVDTILAPTGSVTPPETDVKKRRTSTETVDNDDCDHVPSQTWTFGQFYQSVKAQLMPW